MCVAQKSVQCIEFHWQTFRHGHQQNPFVFKKEKNNKNLETKLQRVWCVIMRIKSKEKKRQKMKEKTHGVPVLFVIFFLDH